MVLSSPATRSALRSIIEATLHQRPSYLPLALCFRATRTLTSLPIDVILEVFYWLEVADVVSLRYTCKLFHDVSQSRSIWLALFNRQISQAWRSPILERPLSSISTIGLQEIVLKKHLLEQNWTSPFPKARLKAAIFNATPDVLFTPMFFELLPGGRWLVIVSELGGVTAWDLDEPTPSEVVINASLERYFTTTVAICINAEAEYLTFDLAVSLVEKDDRRNLQTRVKIWRIALDPIPKTGGSLLGSEVSDFAVQGDIQCASLHGNLYAYVARPPNLSRALFTIIVLQWSEAGPVSGILRMVIDNPYRERKPTDFRLISPSQLFLVTRTRSALYDLAEAPANGARASLPVWAYEFARSLPAKYYMSKPDPYHKLNGQRPGTWISIYGGGDIYQLFLSASPPSASRGYQMTASEPTHFQSQAHVGRHWGLWSLDRRRRDTYTLYRFPSNTIVQGPEVGPTHPIERTIRLDPRTAELQTAGPTAFDEGTGRLCLFVDPSSLESVNLPPLKPCYKSWIVHVVDFA